MTDEQTLEILVDLANALEAAAVNVKHKISGIMNVEKEPLWDPSKIKWTEAQGIKGSYMRSEDVDNEEFKAMMEDLEAHNGKLTRNGWFFWKFSESDVVGRKKRK